MDHDLLLDLRHLDDPEPPRFGELRAEEAARRAAAAHSRRARLLAAAVLVVALVAGVGAAAIGGEGTPDRIETAGGPPTSAEPTPDEPAFVPSSLPSEAGEPGGGTPTTIEPPPPPPPSTTPAPPAPVPTSIPGPGPGPDPGGGAPGGPSGTGPPAAGPPAPPPRASGQPPGSAVAAPAGLRFTLTLEAAEVRSGSSLSGVVRFENHRSTPVTIVGGGCSMWRADLYDAGRKVTGLGPICPMALRRVVEAGAVEQAPVTVETGPELRAGTYDAFSTIGLHEDGVGIHTERQVITVVRS